MRALCRHQNLLLRAAFARAEQRAGNGASEVAAVRDGAGEAARCGVCKAEEPGQCLLVPAFFKLEKGLVVLLCCWRNPVSVSCSMKQMNRFLTVVALLKHAVPPLYMAIHMNKPAFERISWMLLSDFQARLPFRLFTYELRLAGWDRLTV